MKPGNTMRLNRYIADCTGQSRRKADELIAAGKVRVNGKAAQTGQSVHPEKDQVTLNGQLLRLQRKQYLLFHKPRGVITTRHDPEGRKTIYNCLPERYHHLDPVGRLDRESSGLLLLTNDGDLLQHLTHPRFAHSKIYRVTVDKPVTEAALTALEAGIEMKPEGKTAFCTVQEVRDIKTVVLVLKTGFNRQIRRSLEALGYDVVKLKRLAMADIHLGDLASGRFRELKISEINRLKRLTQAKPAKPGKVSRKSK